MMSQYVQCDRERGGESIIAKAESAEFDDDGTAEVIELGVRGERGSGGC